MLSLGQLAEQLGLPLNAADAGVELLGLAPVERAGPGELTFISDKRYLSALADTRAGCVILREEWAEACPVACMHSADPYYSYAKASALFDTQPPPAPGIHPSAVVDPAAIVPDSCSVGPNACIEAGVVLGEGVVIGANVFVGRESLLGAGTRIEAGAVIYHQVRMGRQCRVHACSVIGSDGFGFARRADGWQKIHQLGGVRIGDFVDIGAGCTIDRGALDDTVISDHVIIDNQVHLAHNCVIGERTAIAGCVGMAGSSIVGADCTFAGQVGVSGHVEICDNAHFTGQARVARSVDEPGTYSSGTPLDHQRKWARNAVRFSQLDALQKRVAELESSLNAALGATQQDSEQN